MRLHHALVRATTLLATTFLAVFVLAGVWWCQFRQPDPTKLNREELLRWLVTCDLGQVSPQTRWLVAKRLDQEFSDEIDWEQYKDDLSAEHLERLWNNVPLILEPWFMDKVNRYHQCEPSGRTAFLDDMIDKLMLWKGLDALSPPSDQTDQPPADLTTVLFKQIGIWRDQAKPEQQKRIKRLVEDVQARWLIRTFGGTLDRPKSSQP